MVNHAFQKLNQKVEGAVKNLQDKETNCRSGWKIKKTLSSGGGT